MSSRSLKTYENLTTNLGKILGKSYEVSKIGSQDDWHDIEKPAVAMHCNCHLFTSWLFSDLIVKT